MNTDTQTKEHSNAELKEAFKNALHDRESARANADKLHTQRNYYQAQNAIARRECNEYKAHADKLAEALRAWEYAGSDGGISMVDWFEVARKKTREALAAYEDAQ